MIRSMSRTWALLAGFVLVASLMVPTSAFAIHQTDEISWQLIMISSYPACSNYHYQMTNKYFEVTTEYLDLYQTQHKGLKPLCLTEQEYEEEYDSSDAIDLLIIVYDRNKGRAELHSENMGGFFSHVGEAWTHNHTIVFCDCSNFKYSDPTWILSHELSHFILYYLGYDKEITEGLVHSMDVGRDYCVEVEYDETCLDKRIRLDTDNFYATVMPPYEPAVGQSLIPDNVSEKIEDSKYRMDMQIQVAKWWLDGKISDADFTVSLEILLEKMGTIGERSSFFAAESPNVVFADGPIDMKQSIEEDGDILVAGDEKSEKILEMHPNGDAINDVPDEEMIPEWFKTRALWWVNEKIDDSSFVAGMEYLYNPWR